MKIQGFPGRGLHFGGNEDRIQLTRPNAGKHMMDTIGEAIVSIVLAIVSIEQNRARRDDLIFSYTHRHLRRCSFSLMIIPAIFQKRKKPYS